MMGGNTVCNRVKVLFAMHAHISPFAEGSLFLSIFQSTTSPAYDAVAIQWR